jgi:tripeptidyl-peptidase-1
MSVSYPESGEYGKHIAEVFKPRKESVKMVVEWLVSSGVEKGEDWKDEGRWVVVFKGGVGMIERLLGMEYWLFRHEITG